MNDPSDRRDAPLSRLGSRTPQIVLGLFLVGLVLLVAGAALRQLGALDPDEMPRSLLARELEWEMAATPAGDGAGWLWQHHQAGERLWTRAWLAVNGQIDYRVFSLATIALQCGALAALLFVLSQALSPRWVATVAGVSVAALLTPAFAGVGPPLGSTGGSGAVLLSLLQLGLLIRALPGTALWWVGIGTGAASLAWSTPGLAPAAALALWSLLTGRRPLLVASGGLLLAGIALAVARTSATSGPALAGTLPALLAWPHGTPVLAAFIWLPALVCVWQWRSGRASGRGVAVMALLAMWGFAHAVVRAFTSGGPADSTEFLFAALVINGGCLVVSRPAFALRPTLGLTLAGAWVIFVADGLIYPRAAAPGPSTASAEAFESPHARDRWPTALRSPLALAPATEDARPAFAAGGAPELPRRSGLPYLGSRTGEDDAATGEFVSAPMRSTFSFLQIRVAGTLRPPETSLVLRLADGRELAPLASPFTSADRWKKVNFATPSEPFRIVARDRSATAWLAFTAPVEFGRLTWLAGKIPPLWPFVLSAGAVALLTGAGLAGRRLRREPSPPPAEAARLWRVAPWMALAAYVVFFSHHVDTTAGPNDSGGYLNSAKLLAGGTLTGTPRIPEGVGLDRDVTLYMPITFHGKDDRLVPEYPVGFPLQVAALAKVLPFERAVYVLMLLQLVLGVVVTQRLAVAFGLGESWAWLAAGSIGLSPVYLFQALQPQSDGPSLVWVTAAVYWAWTSRDAPRRAILAGLATALAVMLRPTNVLAVVPIVACFAGRGMIRRGLLWAGAGLPAGAWLLWYQDRLYGSWHTTGYGSAVTFGLRFLVPTLKSYAAWLPEMFTPLVGLACGAPFLRSVAAPARVVLALWVAVFVAFYAVYWCTWDNWYNMRFVLPAAPAMVVMGLLVARALLRRLAARGNGAAAWWRQPRFAVAAAALLLGFLGWRNGARDVLYWLKNNHEHAFAARWVNRHVPSDAVIFAKHATGSLMHYTERPFIRSDHPKAQESTRLFDQLEGAGRPIYALNYHWETAGYRDGGRRGSGYPDLPGTWERVAFLWEDDLILWKRRPSPPAGTPSAEAPRPGGH